MEVEGRVGLGRTPPIRVPHPSPPQIGVWYSNRTLAMNATTLDINLSQTLANKTLVVTTILVSGPCGEAVEEGPFLSGAQLSPSQKERCSAGTLHAPVGT